jgi:hypothetical protein
MESAGVILDNGILRVNTPSELVTFEIEELINDMEANSKCLPVAASLTLPEMMQVP